MIQQLMNDIRNHFEAKSSLTSDEQQLFTQLQAGYYPITSIHRADLECKGFDTRKVSDSQMVELARKMTNDYLEQLFWLSMEIIAEGMDLSRYPNCPNCGNKDVQSDTGRQFLSCQACGQKWHEDLYALVEASEDIAYFKKEFIGYPCQNGTCYISEYEYIKYFQKEPNNKQSFKPIRWPESQHYLSGGNLTSEACQPILDEFGVKDFGTNAVWVPLS